MKKSLIISVVLLLSVICSITASAWTVEEVVWDEVEVEYFDTYTDGPSEWAVEEVDKAYMYDIIPEFTDYPGYQDAITREQFAELVVRMMETSLLSELDVAGLAFDDCANPQVLKAYAAGVVNGVGDNLFDPKTTTNREEIATMLSRAINFMEARKGIDVTPFDADISAFADSTQVSDWAAQGVGVLAANGLMKGTSETTLSPKDPCTVEQSILLVCRIFELF